MDLYGVAGAGLVCTVESLTVCGTNG